MRRLLALLFCSACAFSAPLAAQRFGPQPSSDTQREILRLREAAWRTFFSNDQEGFKRIVPRELLALGWDGGPWNDRAATLVNMVEFAKSGQVLETLEFPRNEFQQYGDVVILYTSFRLVLKRADGTRNATTGRGTEVFVRLPGGGWAHTAWHLDKIAT